MIEQFGPKILSTTRLESARVASAHGKRCLYKAASAAATRQRTASPKSKSSSPSPKRIILRSRGRTPERGSSTQLALTSAPGVKADVIHPVVPKRTRQSTRSPIARKSAQAVSVADRVASPSITLEERANMEMRAQASVGKGHREWLLCRRCRSPVHRQFSLQPFMLLRLRARQAQAQGLSGGKVRRFRRL